MSLAGPHTASDQDAPPARSPVIVGIATTGRPGILLRTLAQLAALEDRPDGVVLSIAEATDYVDAGQPSLPFPVEVLHAPKGLCAQRNAILDAVPGDAVLLFLDDDFLVQDGYISATRRAFAADRTIVMTTGTVLADGILGPGLDHAAGLAALAAARDVAGAGQVDTYNGYGCNMALRMSVVQAKALRFDTNLPRYAWLEDVDFSRRLAAHGRIVKRGDLRGVHLGTKTGRSRGVPLGYSQIANPIYLIRKGTMSRRRAWRLMLRNVAANSLKLLRPEPWVDRRGRLRGNALALRDALTGRLSPQRICDL